jgi:hypothetical protein
MKIKMLIYALFLMASPLFASDNNNEKTVILKIEAVVGDVSGFYVFEIGQEVRVLKEEKDRFYVERDGKAFFINKSDTIY